MSVPQSMPVLVDLGGWFNRDLFEKRAATVAICNEDSIRLSFLSLNQIWSFSFFFFFFLFYFDFHLCSCFPYDSSMILKYM